ncbi:hypothetical protein L2E82_39607 [Cichorium intybus]|uniref:Uncharacterized protein n=1 Tax=Cichorium intybus TaxID=13427 RepID=A0ACB9AJN3_CICIN|nr:hypothetical protein L2E82_39607 [Cichorium intybus]
MLSFNSDDWPVFRDLTTSRLEILITQTIFQTKGLQVEFVDLESIVVCFPDLRYLALSYDLRDDLKEGVLHYSLQGELPLENMRVLDIGMNPNSINNV